MRLATKLAETENLFETLANGSPVGICIIQDGRFCYINPTFLSNTGYNEDELLGKDSLEIVFPEDREQVRENTIKILKGKLSRPYQFRVTHKDGNIHWVIESVASVQYRGRQATLATFIDVTEQKQTDEALQAEKNKLQSLVDAMDTTLTIQDTEFNIIFQNEKSRIASGGDHLGEKCYRAYEGRETVCPGCPVEKAFKDGKPHTTENKTVKPSGEVVFWEITANPIRDAEGRIVTCLEIARNVTERKQMVEAQKETEEEKSAFLEEAPIGIIHTDLKGKITYVNKRFESDSGYSREEIISKNGLQLDWFPAGTMKYLAKRITDRLRGGSAKRWETQFKCKDGRWIWIELEGKILRKLGVPVGFQIIARNINERKRADEALQAEKNKLQSVIDAMADNLSMVDKDYNITYQNAPARKIWSERTGEKCYRVFEGREEICVGCPVEKAFKDGKPHIAERRAVTPSGKVTFWENTANPVRDARGEIISCLEIGRDITERKQAEEELQTEKNKLQSLIDAMEDGLIIQDRDYNIIYQNEPLKEIYGDHLGEKCYRAYTSGDKMCDDCPVAMAFKDGKSHTMEKEVTLPSGKVIFWEPTANPIRDAKGKVVACLEVVRDITERKKAEKELSKTQAQLSSAAQIAHLGPWEYDAINDLFIFNDAFYELFHTTAEEVGGYTMSSAEYARRFVHPEDAHLVSEEVRKALQADNPSFSSQVDHRIIYANGEVGYISVRFFIIKDKTGGTVRTYGVNQDITERKEHEQALADELTRRRILIDQSLDGIVVLDTDARVVEANRRFAEMLGYTHKEVYKLHTWDWDKNFPPKQILEMGRNVDEKGLHLETKHTRKDGSVIDVDISINAAIFGEQKLIFCVCRDITERKRTVEALKNSEESYRELADSITDVFFAMDEHLRYTYWNKASEILTGTRAEDAIGKSLSEVFPDTPELKKAEKVYRTVLKKQQSQTFVNDFDIDGRHYTFEISAYPSKGGISVFAIDITERRKAEEALNLQRAYFQQLFDNSPDAIIMVDTDRKVLEANRTFETLFSYSVEEITGKPINGLVIPKERTSEASALTETILTGQVFRKETKRIRKDGSPVDVSVLSYPISFDDKVVGAYIVYSDITKRKKMEEAIRQAAEEWRKTFDSIHDAISIHGRDHQILRANKAFADLFHKKPPQIIGRHCYELHKGAKPKSGCPHQKTLATKKPAEAEFYESNLGKYLHESTSPIFDETGEVVGTIHVTRDITEQKQQHERLMMADRLASIGELAAGTAHELNNPLTSVIGFSQLLIERDVPEDIREDIKLIYSEAQRAASVTKNLLTFARKHAPVKQLSQINNIIEDVLKLRAYEHKVNGIEVKRQLAPDLPEIRVDYFQMQQVFLNIIINAEYFMIEAHKRGTLTITTKKEESNLIISIADNGPGISKENLSRIFNPFFTTKEAGKGTGLGLSICHGIVAEHGGQIYAKSQPGKGATIFVELPIEIP
jgi:PAS domain S-box-containing protein